MSTNLIIDIVFTVAVLVIILINAKQGLIKAVIQTVKWVISFILASQFGTMLGELLDSRFFHGKTILTDSLSLANLLGYALVFILSLVALSLAAKLLTAIIDKIPIIRTINHLLGAIWGVLAACVLLFAAASIVKIFVSEEIFAASYLLSFFGNSDLLTSLKIFDVGQNLLSSLTA